MKKLNTLALISIFCLLIPLKDTFAGEPLKNGPTIKLAIIMPESEFGKFNNNLGNADAITGLVPYQQLSTSVGFGLQLGTMYFIASLNEDETMKIGIDVTWLGVSYQSVKYAVLYNENTEGNFTEFDMYHISLYPEVGPSFSYSPTESMAVDVSFKLTPTIGLMGGAYDNSLGDKLGMGGTGFGLRYTPALYFRYNVLLVGAEYSLGDLNFNYALNGGSLPDGTSSGSSPYSTLRIVLGVKF